MFFMSYLTTMVIFFITYLMKIWFVVHKKNNYIPSYVFSHYSNQLNAGKLTAYLRKSVIYKNDTIINNYDEDNKEEQEGQQQQEEEEEEEDNYNKTNEIENHRLFKNPFLYFAAINAKFFKDYKILNGVGGSEKDKQDKHYGDKNDSHPKARLILPHPPTVMTAFTIPYRSLVFNKNYKLSKADILTYTGKNKSNETDNDAIPPVTDNCAGRPPVASVVLYGYQKNIRDNSTEMLMCDCRDHRQLLKLPTTTTSTTISAATSPPSSSSIEINTNYIPSLTFPYPGLKSITSEPSSTISAAGVKHPIMGSTLVNRPGTLLLDLNGPCTGFPDGSYTVVESIDHNNQDENIQHSLNGPSIASTSGNSSAVDYRPRILREDLNLYLNTHPLQSQTLWMDGHLVGGNSAPSRVNCVSGVPFRLE